MSALDSTGGLYLDAAALLLLAADHSRKANLIDKLKAHVKAGGQVLTSAAALECVQEYFLARSDATSLRQFWNALDGLFREILPLRGEDLGRALDIQEYSRSTPAGASGGEKSAELSPAPGRALTATQALHAAIALNQEIEWIADPENCYGDIPGIKAFEF